MAAGELRIPIRNKRIENRRAAGKKFLERLSADKIRGASRGQNA